jgi:CRP/FNR family nitrogen fixation transcriptional regulator
MEDSASDVFDSLLENSDPCQRRDAVAGLAAAARETSCGRNQPCDTLVGPHRVACVLFGAVRKFTVRANGQRQIVDLLIRGDFLGLVTGDPVFLY